jgi:molybdate transport system substrate-binding protein
MNPLVPLALLAMTSSGGWAPSASQEPVTVRVAAASDLRFALDEVMKGFRSANPEISIEPSYGSSGNFFAQIRQGAPFDVFLSADAEYTRRLFAEGVSEAPFAYAIGRLALVVRKDSGLDPRGFGDLLRSPAIRRVAIANPAHAPYGRAAEAALRTWRVYDAVAPKLVLGDSVSQATQFVDTGAAQAALVALSLVKVKTAGLVFAEVPETAHPPLDQAGIVLKRSTVTEGARAFQAFITSDTGRSILARYGFGLPSRQ